MSFPSRALFHETQDNRLQCPYCEAKYPLNTRDNLLEIHIKKMHQDETPSYTQSRFHEKKMTGSTSEGSSSRQSLGSTQPRSNEEKTTRVITEGSKLPPPSSLTQQQPKPTQTPSSINFLKSCHLEQYQSKFVEAGFESDITALVESSPRSLDQFIEYCGMATYNHKLTFTNAIDKLRNSVLDDNILQDLKELNLAGSDKLVSLHNLYKERTEAEKCKLATEKCKLATETKRAETEKYKLEAENRKLEVEREKTRRLNLELEYQLDKGSTTRSQLYKRTAPAPAVETDFLKPSTYSELPLETLNYLNTTPIPQAGSLETKTQNWFNDLMKTMDNTWNVRAIDTHTNPYLGGFKPDISVFDPENIADGAYVPIFVRTVLELKQRKSDTSNLTDEDKGQLIDYIQILVRHQPLRRFFPAFLSDAANFYIMLYDRNRRKYSEYSTTFTHGFKLFYAMLTTDSDLVKITMPELKHVSEGMILRRFLGSGSSGIVYEANDNGKSAVVKFAITSRFPALKQEYNILKLLNDNIIKNIPSCIKFEEGTLVMQPVCTRIEYNLQRGHIQSLLSLLKNVHDLHIIHRDVRPSNIMIDPEGKIMLVDWGSALTISSQAEVPYEGTVTYASPAILKKNLERHSPTPADDLHSFIRTVFKLLHPRYKLDTDRTAQSIRNFWERALASNFWKQMSQAADDCDYATLEILCDLFFP